MYGIPNMKLPKSVVRRRIDLMSEEGVTFVCGVDAAEDAVAKRLLAEYDAVILCCGAGEPRPLGLDTAGVAGVCCGTEYLKSAVERAQLGREETAAPSAAGLDVVIVGTGDTASDCVATALRQGCRSVTQLVRRPRGGLSGQRGSAPAGLRPRGGPGRHRAGPPALFRPGQASGDRGERRPRRRGHH